MPNLGVINTPDIVAIRDARVVRTSQAYRNVGATTLTTPAVTAEWMICMYGLCVVAADATGNITFKVNYNDDNGAQTKNVVTIPSTAVGFVTNQVSFHAATGANITYSGTVASSPSSTARYVLYLDLRRIA